VNVIKDGDRVTFADGREFIARASRSCERYSRNHGGVYKTNCDICGRGPCQHNAYKDARDVPNRLYGAFIKGGEAV
jgi:hypothetical protein